MLTRREADRALDHGLGDQPVHRFMRAGHVMARPEDSITALRKLMIDSNWGQIPVADDHGDIVGIVTRTDLIKLWDESARPDRRAGELARRLREALNPVQHHLLQLIGAEVDRMNYAAYVVGGFVRDLMLDTTSKRTLAMDVDIVIEGDAIAFAQRMQGRYGGRVVEHKRFGTAKWLLVRGDAPVNTNALLRGAEMVGSAADLPPHLDFVTARTEFYTEPSVLPTVQQSSIKLDLHRRDFTINTLALCLNPDRWGELLDFWGGLADLRAGVVRVLHSLSFVDDPTRILRAVRYEQRFDFVIESRTLELLGDALELLDRVTPARIRHELERILQENLPEKALLRLDELGILRQLMPELRMTPEMAAQFMELRARLRRPDIDPALLEEPIERLYWAIVVFPLAPSVHDALQDRLGLRSETQRMMHSMGLLRRYLSALADEATSPSRIVTILDQVRGAALALMPVVCQDDQVLEHIRRYRETWRFVQPELDGNALRQLGVPRGAIYRQILAALRAGRLDGTLHSREDEVALVREMASVR
ncbi:MAG: CBS domain-containing protein [Caldilineaceae bacterium]|nr:CBS domain-containing protein [Caldilineaceae bacterium]